MLRWVADRHLPSHRTPGGRWRIRRSDLDAFMHQRGMPVTGERVRTPRSQAAGAARVAIVEDEAHHAAALRRLLDLLLPGALVRVATDGFSAGLLLAEQRPDLVFLDIELPGLDGIGVVRQLRASLDLQDMRIVVVSGHLTPERIAALQALGVDDIWAKPIDPARVAGLVDRWEQQAAGADTRAAAE